MPNRRSQITMSPEEIEVFLEGRRTINVATNGVGGYPHVVAMWYCLLDGKPAFWTFGKAQKVMNLRRDPKISALVEAGETYDTLQGVELVGTARVVDDVDTVLAIGKAVALRYRGAASETPESIALLEAQARKRVGVVIDVERTVSWDHTKLSGGY